MRKIAAVTVAALLVLLPVARALVILGGSGTANFTTLGAGLPWNNVGSVNGDSAVYLGDFGGDYWVLTASHVVGSGSTLGNLTLGSGTYSYVPGSGVVVRNGDSSTSDLTLFRISSDPGLANLTLASSAPANGSTITYVAKGHIEGSANYWSVADGPGPSDAVWTNQGGNPGGANAAGYLWAAAAGERWGQNTVTAAASYNVGTGNTAAFYSTFQNTPGSTQGATGDSGGATFYYNGTGWQLAGILGAVGTLENQPGSTAVLGDVTYSASIANYYSFISSTVGITAIPEPSTYAALAAFIAFGTGLVVRRRR